ncbi:KSR1 [Cordylochernes scorpioides]|uniref:KSR1 n=1 Tax=Cordylochernes scorpioides TaxID=51811 RepID=A0ABY6LQ39_9ARAC|nr:KSR1 [Cordylochernes scorpioides]
MAQSADSALNKALEACTTAQDMIDLSAERLEGLRTQCAISAELTQLEIRSLESKLINLYSKQLVAKKRYGKYNEELNKYPQIRQWLKVVGLNSSAIKALCDKLTTMEALLEASDNIIKEILLSSNSKEEEIRPLLIALTNLKNHTKRQLRGDVNALGIDLFWDSWVTPKRYSPAHTPAKSLASRSFGSSDKILKKNRGASNLISNRKSIDNFNFDNNYLSPDSFITKSKSHEENLATQFESLDIDRPKNYSKFTDTESSSLESSFNQDQDFESYLQSIQPRSFGMGHQINHKFTSTVTVTLCDFCGKSMVYGFKCKYCKNSYHRDCVGSVPPSCGLPTELVHIFAETLKAEGNISPNLNRKIPSPLILKKSGRKKSHRRSFISSSEDSSSTNSSCNSSTSTSPSFVLNTGSSKFHFPSGKDKGNCYRIDDIEEMIETQKSNDSDKTMSGTLRSTDSDKTITSKLDSQGSDISERSWTRNSCLSLNEWDIPFDEIDLGEELGSGRFGTVYKGNWHGRVAIKMLNMDKMNDSKATLETFKQEVAIFRKTRHENLILFMGACMKPPHLAIITSLCKGNTLYTEIHIRKNKYNLNKLLSISKQIAQGMGYLHARGIVHKDLKTKNIFYENGKVIITDFGLFSVTNLCRGNRKGAWLTIPKGWLCYLAPEVIRLLKTGDHHQDYLPFTTASDMYAFGTVWYELLCTQWPFSGQPSESIIWQVGKGVKPTLANLQASKEIKTILVSCWAYTPRERPEFSKLQSLLTRIPLVPRKKLIRSPSYTHQFQVSAESLF